MPKFLQFASITKKITLALIGLFLMAFIVVHLGINLCMLRNDGGEWFRAAAHFMGTNYIIKVFEIVLFGAIALHILLALIIQIHNWRARPVGYAASSKTKTAFGSKLMIWTGLLVASFLVVHFVNFYFVKMGWVDGHYIVKVEDINRGYSAKQQAFSKAYTNAQSEEERAQIEEDVTTFQEGLSIFQTNEKISTALQYDFKHIEGLSKADAEAVRKALDIDYEPDFYIMAHQLFKNIWVVLAYLFFMIALGFHLAHAFPSAFQTLGLAHSKYTPAIKIIGLLFAVGVSVGFAIIPLFFYFFK